MAKKTPKTFHPLQVANSLTVQNEAVGKLLMVIQSAHGLAGVANIEQLRQLVGEIHKTAEEARRVLWPDESGD